MEPQHNACLSLLRGIFTLNKDAKSTPPPRGFQFARELISVNDFNLTPRITVFGTLLTQLPPTEIYGFFCKQDKNDFHGKESLVVSFLFFFFLLFIIPAICLASCPKLPWDARGCNNLQYPSKKWPIQFPATSPTKAALLARSVSVPNTPAYPAAGEPRRTQDIACLIPPTESFSAQHFQGSLLFYPAAGRDILLGFDAHRCRALLVTPHRCQLQTHLPLKHFPLETRVQGSQGGGLPPPLGVCGWRAGGEGLLYSAKSLKHLIAALASSDLPLQFYPEDLGPRYCQYPGASSQVVQW